MEAITTTGTITAVHTDGRTFDAELPNGKRVRAFLPTWLTDPKPEFHPGDRVALELSPYDFSKARITAAAE